MTTKQIRRVDEMKNVMAKAWEIARKGASKFGGCAKEYFAKALKMAWSLIKKESSLDKKYNELKYMVRAEHTELQGRVDGYFLKTSEMIEYTGMTRKEFEFEMKWADPGKADSWEVGIDGIICNVYVMKKYIHEM